MARLKGVLSHHDGYDLRIEWGAPGGAPDDAVIPDNGLCIAAVGGITHDIHGRVEEKSATVNGWKVSVERNNR